jgi:glucose-fructose oxidoreductase
VSFGAASTSTYQLVGTKGSLRLENAYDYKGKMTLELQTKGTKKRTLPARDQIGPEISYFSDCILKDQEVEPSGWEGLADVRIIRALYESARSGRSVRLEPFEKRQRPTGEQEQRRPPTSPPEPVNAAPPMGE